MKLLKFIKLNKFIFLLGFICIAMFSYWQWSSNFTDPDAFYHMKTSQLIFENGIIKDFPWQQYTSLKDGFTDHHLLYHILLIPFVVLIKPLIGIKIAVVFLATAFVLIFAFIFKKLELKGAWLFGLLMALTVPFTFRLNLVKANSLSLIILFLGIYFIYRKKYKLLFILSFLYVWSYGGFILLFLIAGLFFIIEFLISRKFLFYNLLAVFLGTVAGLIINPYFPKNLKFYWQQVIEIGVLNYQDKIGVGGEWYSYGFVELITDCSLLTVFLFIALLLFLVFIKKQNRLSWFSFCLFIVGLFLVLKSRRYIEYYVPFAVFFTANSFNVFLKNYWHASYKNYIFSFWQKNIFNKIIIFIISVYVLLIVPVIIIKDFNLNKRDLINGNNYYQFQKACNWLEENTAKGDIVLHSDWDEWPQLFFHNTHNYYIVGLDPTFMYNYNEELYWQWVNITIGKQKKDLPSIIKNNFKASYVFLETDHVELNSNLQKFEEFQLVYEDEEVKIYQVL